METKKMTVFAAVIGLICMLSGCQSKKLEGVPLAEKPNELTPDRYTVALYHFNGDFKDSSGNGRDLKVENPLNFIHFWDSVSPNLGQALCLSQTHEVQSGRKSVIFSPDLRYPGEGSWTVEALIYVGYNATAAKVAEHYSEGIAAHEPYSLQFFGDNNRQLAAFTIDDAQGKEWEITGLMTKGEWHSIAGVWDDETGEMRLYVDNVLKAKQKAARPEKLTGHNVYIGGESFGLYGPVLLDELRISNCARKEFMIVP
jgi:hypothetical protein